MGLSYDQIINLQQGNEIGIRHSLNELIIKYENQIEELQLIIKFMKYVKGLGFIPSPPNELIGSSDFKSYLVDYMDYIDKDKKIEKLLSITEFFSNNKNFEDIAEETFNDIEKNCDEILPNVCSEDKAVYTKTILSLIDKTHLDPASDEIQKTINETYDYQKKILGNNNLSVWDFSRQYIYMLSCDSDISMVYKNILGEKAFNFLLDSLIQFLLINEPDKMKCFIKGEKNEQT